MASRVAQAARMRAQHRRAAGAHLEEYNFTEAIALFAPGSSSTEGKVPISTPEDSYMYNGADDLLEERGGSPTMRHYSDMLISEPKSGRRVWIGRKEVLEEDDDYHSTVRPAVEIIEIGGGSGSDSDQENDEKEDEEMEVDENVKEDQENLKKKKRVRKFRASLRYCNRPQSEMSEEALAEGYTGEGLPWDGHRTSAMLRTQQVTIRWYRGGDGAGSMASSAAAARGPSPSVGALSSPSTSTSTSTSASTSSVGEITVAMVKAWTEWEVAGWALTVGFPDLYDPIVGMVREDSVLDFLDSKVLIFLFSFPCRESPANAFCG